ncbi:hypothetical protein EE612_034296 [Oryza sativa]|nr:hypothetical protein EE612_034296 [Oryza sativa]
MLEFQWLLSLRRGWHSRWGNFLVFFIHKTQSHILPKRIGYIFIAACSSHARARGCCPRASQTEHPNKLS